MLYKSGWYNAITVENYWEFNAELSFLSFIYITKSAGSTRIHNYDYSAKSAGSMRIHNYDYSAESAGSMHIHNFDYSAKERYSWGEVIA